MKIKGQITKVAPAFTFESENGDTHRKQYFILTEQYNTDRPNDAYAIALFDDRIDKYAVSVGDNVIVTTDSYAKISEDGQHAHTDLKAVFINPQD